MQTVDHSEADQPVEGYTLATAAHKLQIHPSTLRFWEESFRKELAVPRNWRGDLIFSDKHLEIIKRIHRMVLGEGRSLAEARHAALQGSLLDGGEDDLGSSHGRGPLSSRRRQEEWQTELEEIRGALTMITENVAYLLEENKALQALFSRLVTHVENQAPARDAAKEHPRFVPEAPIRERIVGGAIYEPLDPAEPLAEEEAAAASDTEIDAAGDAFSGTSSEAWSHAASEALSDVPGGPAGEFAPGASDAEASVDRGGESVEEARRAEEGEDVRFVAGITTSEALPYQPNEAEGRILGSYIKRGATHTIGTWEPGELRPPSSSFLRTIRSRFAS